MISRVWDPNQDNSVSEVVVGGESVGVLQARRAMMAWMYTILLNLIAKIIRGVHHLSSMELAFPRLKERQSAENEMANRRNKKDSNRFSVQEHPTVLLPSLFSFC